MAKKRSKPLEDVPVENPNMTTFSDITFQLLIFFMLTIQFKQEEGNLISLLPKDKGLANTSVDTPELQEVRIYICADVVDQIGAMKHIGAKEDHQQKVAGYKAADKTIGDKCRVWIEQNYLKNEIFEVFRTERYPGNWKHNRDLYKSVAQTVKNMRDSIKSSRDAGKPAPVIIDSDGLVPWEHPFGFLNALQRMGIQDVEWAGNPRFDKYFGPTSGN